MNTRAILLSVFCAFTALAIATPSDARAKAAPKHGAKPKTPRGLDPERLRHDVEARVAKRRDHLEQLIVRKKVPAAKAGAMRQEFNQSVVEARNKLAAALADGKVTAEEARAVRAATAKIGRR